MTWILPPKIRYPLLVMLLAGVLMIVSDSSLARRPYPRAFQDDPGQPAYPQISIIDCDFATPDDRLVVYDQNRKIGAQDSAAIEDFTDAIWIFDARADGSAQLIIRFAAGPGQAIAYLFDDRDGDGQVAYEARGREIIITESENWHVKAVASPTWITSAGSVNPNISFFIDGPILRYLSWGEAYPGLAWPSQDAGTGGHPDWVVEVVDRDADGIADYQLQRLLSASPKDVPVFRSTLYVNEKHAPAVPYPQSLFWLLLVSSHAYETYNYFDHPPVIAVDWDQARIDRVGILGYPAEQGYHINSRAAWLKGQVNYADFENPMAYYDLAADRDGRPELFVRFEVFAPHDRFFLNGSYPGPMTEVEYAWDQDNDGRWDYQLSLAGPNPITSTLDFPDFSIRSLPYAQIPAWAAARSWAAAVFVAAQQGGHWNSEGMSVWNVNRGYRDGSMIEPSGLRDEYLTGLSDQPPVGDYSEIPSGFRGEVAFDSFRQPTLYLSAIDRELHLKYATHGLWAIGADREIRYSNLAGEPYLDHWEYFKNGALHQELVLLEDVLLYAGGDEVRLKMVSAVPVLSKVERCALRSPASCQSQSKRTFNFQRANFVRHNLQPPSVETPVLFETPPPRDHAEWLALGERLAENAAGPVPVDLLETYSTFQSDRLHEEHAPQSETLIRLATVHDPRRMEAGFRFVLHLAPGFSVIGADLIGLRGRPSGSYLVIYDGEFRAQALSPAVLELRPEPGIGPIEPLQQYTPGEVRLRIVNLGLADAHQVIATARISQPGKGQAALLLDPQTMDIPGGEAVVVKFPWTPGAAGAYSIQFAATWLDDGGGVARTQAQQRTLTVLPAAEAGELETFGIFGLVRPGKVVLLMALVVAAGGFAAQSILYPGLSAESSITQARESREEGCRA